MLFTSKIAALGALALAARGDTKGDAMAAKRGYYDEHHHWHDGDYVSSFILSLSLRRTPRGDADPCLRHDSAMQYHDGHHDHHHGHHHDHHGGYYKRYDHDNYHHDGHHDHDYNHHHNHHDHDGYYDDHHHWHYYDVSP